MIKTYLYTFTSLFLFIGCDTLNETDNIIQDYPKILKEMSPSDQDSLRNLYATLNPEYECAVINKFGLNDSDICLDRTILRKRVDSTDIDRLNEMSEDFLIKNTQFTNVSDLENLILDKFSYSSGCISCDGSENDHRSTIGIKFTYENQVYGGLEIMDSQISVFVDAQKVFNVYGHWFNDIVIPETDNFDHEKSRKSLIGKELIYYDWSGRQSMVLEESSFTEVEEKVILPYKTESGLELRVCNIVATDLWHLYVDSTTGELLKEKILVDF